ncbi:aminotransferase class I/II-fold pyridoxal phosphate-dependent enzyme [Elizabethkingia argentiflava]|uniref:Aminotransferase class I/II-fold pyridoxal phosphate-dependent enzyme n=1 Tax=Elizabethkingia argenteiflava TaxID=2681556 RepID=A0A845PV63_9FLAO|nr:DegT/DnrJ/EryC1/StrS family aminotransferase [Elizabethkingia argenteiflava]NAW52112.1 aminotransferase class I/II-fold pyridoxal phosphate-dependent enzyme [Elizabethkingia argenteiflava]
MIIDLRHLNLAADTFVKDKQEVIDIDLEGELPQTKTELESLIREESYPYSNGDKIEFLPLPGLNSPQELSSSLKAVEAVAKTGKFTSGPYVNLLEKELESFYKVSTCVATSSGTDALMIALKAVGVGVGDEVIIPPNSFAATENAVFAVGAKPVFVNIDFSYNLDVSEIKLALTSKTKAIIPVCLYGSARNIEEICDFGKANNLPVIVDAAQCFGIGSLADMAEIVCLSFNPFKNLGAFGKSGALLTHHQEYAHQARQFSYHGFREGEKNVKSMDWGFNSRMDNLQAAVLLAKLEYFSRNALKRCYLAHKYLRGLDLLQNRNKIKLPLETRDNTWHLFPIWLEEGEVSDMISYAKSKNVELDIYYPSLGHEYQTQYAASFSPTGYSLQQSEHIHGKLIHLPLYNHMSLEQQDKIISVVRAYFKL